MVDGSRPDAHRLGSADLRGRAPRSGIDRKPVSGSNEISTAEIRPFSKGQEELGLSPVRLQRAVGMEIDFP